MSALAVLRCIGVIAASGQRCTAPAKPGSRRCGKHTRVPPEGRRCQHTFDTGQRCEGWTVTKAKNAVVCPAHFRECAGAGCTRRITQLEGLCKSCQAAADRAARKAAVPPPMTPAQKWETKTQQYPLCAVQHTAQTGQPCRGLAMQPGNPYCSKHRAIPADADRCTFIYDDGERCVSRWSLHTDQRCTHHGSGVGKGGHKRGQYKGDQPIYRPCPVCGKKTKGVFGCAAHAPSCEGTTADGSRCPRTATVALGDARYCKTHARQPVTPAPPPAKGGHRFLCGIASGAQGTPCRMPVAAAGQRCHKHPALPDQDRCMHVYASGERCPRRKDTSRKSATCSTHHIPNSRHTVQCAATAAHTGQRCLLPADVDSGVCTRHQQIREELDTRPRCRHLHATGTQCTNVLPVNGTHQYRQLCQLHAIACVAPGCERATYMADGLCKQHRPRCGQLLEGGGTCRRPAYEDSCWAHTETDRCALVTRYGEPCQMPAVHDTGEGRICTQHLTKLPAEEARCTHVHPSGQRCALAAQDGTFWCTGHQAEHSTTCTAISAQSGVRCAAPVIPRPGEGHYCPQHRREVPDQERCTHVHDGGQRCRNHQVADLATCAAHTTSTRCAVTTPTGQPCQWPVVVRPGRAPTCVWHSDLPKPHARCIVTFADGSRCPGTKLTRGDHCYRHQTQRPWCAAVDAHGVRCGHRADGGRDTCDRHVHWKPGDPLRADDPAALWRFFLRPNAEYIWETINSYAAEATWQAENAPTSHRTATVDPTKVGKWESGEPMDLERLADIDPFDLTGAQRNYVTNKEYGFTDEELQYAAERTLERYSPSTLRALTGKLRNYLQFCHERHLVPVPAERTTITRYLSYLTIEAQKTHGHALQPSSIDQFRHAIQQAHEIAGYENPWTKWPVLAGELRGYRRLFSRPVIQAHAIRLDELAALVGAANASAGLSARDAAILTIVTDPEVGISLRNAAALTWENISWYDVDDPQPTSARVGTKEYFIPNRASEPMAEDLLTAAGDVPMSMRLCGTTALRSLAAELVAADQGVAGPVFRKDDGSPMTHEGIAKIVKESAERAGIPKAPTYPVEARIQLLEAASAPDPLGLRDAAIMNVMWWGSLRRSEVGPLTIGDLGKDNRDRGLILLIRASKTDVDGQYVPIPYDRDHQGNPRPTDAWAALQRWFSAYETLIGRPLTPQDPLFINIRHGKGKAVFLSERSVGQVIQRYAVAAGIQAELGERISSHGFRAGYATESLAKGISSEAVAKTQRRDSTQSLLGYNRPSDPFESLLANTMETAEEAWERFEMAKLNAQVAKDDNKHNRPSPRSPQ